MVVVMMVLMAALVMVMVVIMVVAAADRADLLVLLPGLRQQFGGQSVALLHGGEELRASELVPGGGDDGGGGVFLPQQSHRGLQLGAVHLLGAAEDDGPGMLDLVFIELAEVLQIDFALGGVRHGDSTAQLHLRDLGDDALDGPDHVGELAHAGGLDEDAVGMELVHDLLQRLAEVPHQGAADAAGVHLADLNAGVL